MLTRRDRLIWAAGFAVVVAAMVITHFASVDPDSSLYAEMSQRLAALPVRHWIAPYWWGLWPGSEVDSLFREHPAGVFLLPALLVRAGIPGEQAAYVVGIAAGLAALVLIGQLVSRVAGREEGRAMLILLQVMPVAFIFRMRANHEYPMLVCLLICLIGLDLVTQSWRAVALVIAGLVGGLLVKGVFVVLILLAAGLWILTNPTRRERAMVRQSAALAIGIVAMAVTVVLYDAIYLRVTGEMFWMPYWTRQMGPLTIASPFDNARTVGSHLVFYATRLLWHPAPWSGWLVWMGWRTIARRGIAKNAMSPAERRGLAFSVAFTVVAVIMLSLPSRFAERYTFSATYVIGTCGAVVAWRTWHSLREWITRMDLAIPGLPALLWTVLMLLRLSLGPFLPRLQDH